MGSGSSRYPGGAKARSGLDPLAYTGVESGQPPDMIQENYDPTTQYTNYNLGTFWVNPLLRRLWSLANLEGSVATWIRMGGISDLALAGNIVQATGQLGQVELFRLRAQFFQQGIGVIKASLFALFVREFIDALG